MNRWIATAAVALLACQSAVAHEETPSRNRASFQVEAAREVANDWATARLAAMAEGPDAAAIAAEVNRTIARAVEQAKRTPAIEVKTGAYSTNPVYDKGRQRVIRWRAVQEVILESSDVERLSRLIGKLQSEALKLGGISFSVQRDTRRALEAELIDEALVAFQERAKQISRGMGGKGWSLVDLAVNPGGRVMHQSYDFQEGLAMSSRASAPALESGTSEVRVGVSGTIELE